MAYSNHNFGQLLHRIENIDIKNNIRSYKKIKKRILSAKYGILFNQTYIYIYNNNENVNDKENWWPYNN